MDHGDEKPKYRADDLSVEALRWRKQDAYAQQVRRVLGLNTVGAPHMDATRNDADEAKRQQDLRALAANIRSDSTHAKVKCLSCNGSGKCDSCNGDRLVDGRKECPDCWRAAGSQRATGKCADCTGLGRVRATEMRPKDSADGVVDAREAMVARALAANVRNKRGA